MACYCESSHCDCDCKCQRPASEYVRMDYVGWCCDTCAANMCASGGADYIHLIGESMTEPTQGPELHQTEGNGPDSPPPHIEAAMEADHQHRLKTEPDYAREAGEPWPRFVPCAMAIGRKVHAIGEGRILQLHRKSRDEFIVLWERPQGFQPFVVHRAYTSGEVNLEGGNYLSHLAEAEAIFARRCNPPWSYDDVVAREA